ncbi:MAG TPA: NUDIX domain-containing protein [Candidatus Saccharimonadales bacterium]|nr:NUDIX domain-containing protein [Candidatus Saccharimonadales bacterium]
MAAINRPLVGIGVFIWKDGKFLMGKRRGAHGDGTWSIPGGHLEFSESWEEGAKREVLEETGLVITNVRFLAATNDIFEKDKKHYITIWVYSDWKSGEPSITEPDKYVDQEWRTFKTLPAPLFEPCWQNLRAAKPELF